MKKCNILLRFDDFCPTMNWEQWGKAKALLDEIGATALIGVIPDCQDPDLLIDPPRPDFWNYVRELQQQGFAIAMHGYRHVFDINSKGIVTNRHPYMKHSEFAGHSYEIQFDRIKKGKCILLQHGIDTDIFFAPAHSYDSNTLKALAANGFRYLSDGKSVKPFKRDGIICFPVHSINIMRIKQCSFYTLVFHTSEWTKKEKQKSYSKMKFVCYNYKDSISSFENLKRCKCGWPFTQLIFEKMYLLWERKLKANMKIIKRKL